MNERIRADHIWLSNPVLVRGLGMAPVIGAALDGQRALMLCIAALILVTFTRVLAVAVCQDVYKRQGLARVKASPSRGGGRAKR